MTIDPDLATYLTGIVTGIGIGLLVGAAVAYLRRIEVYVSTDEQTVIDMHRDGLPARLIIVESGDDLNQR